MLDFRLCVLTIVNTSPAIIRYSPEVSFFEPGPVATTTSLPMLPSATPQLDIRNCVLRGDATVIRLRDAALERRDLREHARERDRVHTRVGSRVAWRIRW